MMKESLKIWNEIENAHGNKLLENGTILNFGHPKSEFLHEIFEHFPENKILNGEEIMEIYPAFKNLPKDYIGMITETGKF